MNQINLLLLQSEITGGFEVEEASWFYREHQQTSCRLTLVCRRMAQWDQTPASLLQPLQHRCHPTFTYYKQAWFCLLRECKTKDGENRGTYLNPIFLKEKQALSWSQHVAQEQPKLTQQSSRVRIIHSSISNSSPDTNDKLAQTVSSELL